MADQLTAGIMDSVWPWVALRGQILCTTPYVVFATVVAFRHADAPSTPIWVAYVVSSAALVLSFVCIWIALKYTRWNLATKERDLKGCRAIGWSLLAVDAYLLTAAATHHRGYAQLTGLSMLLLSAALWTAGSSARLQAVKADVL